MNEKPFAPHTQRNSEPILEVLRNEFQAVHTVLEIGSGTGQHALAFAAELDYLTWQTSDLDENHAAIRAWMGEASLPNIIDPLSLDVLTGKLPPQSYDAVFSANTAHIMSFEAVEKMFALTASVLHANGVFCLYGPYRQDREFNAPSNAEFHRSLQQQDPEMGIRHLEDLDRFAATGGMRRVRLYAMPANNFIAVWRISDSGAPHDET